MLGCLVLFATAGCTGDPEEPAGLSCPLTVTREFSNVSLLAPALPDTTGPCLIFDDLDGDGTVELVTNTVFVNVKSQLDLFQYDGAEFIHVRTLLEAGANAVACTAGDYDNDGLLDIYAVTREVHERHLFHNDGGLAFSEPANVLPAVQPTDIAYFAHGFFDYDNDGFVDLMIGRYVGVPELSPSQCVAAPDDIYCPPIVEMETAESLMLHNVGGKSFELLPSGSFPAPWATMTHSLTTVDWDGDGFLDVFLANDFGENHFYRNEAGGGTFIDRRVEFGFAGNNNGMGAAMGDFNRDGLRDIVIADLGPARLLMGTADGGATNRAVEFGVADATRYTSSWTPLAADFDHDGDEDILMVTAFIGTNDEDVIRIATSSAAVGDPYPQHDLMLWNDGAAFSSAELPHRFPNKHAVIYGASASADYDGDGDLDIALMAGLVAEFRILRNDLDAGNWLKIELLSAPTQTATGSRVTLFKDGAPIAMREYHTSTGSVGISQRILHFGLCEMTEVDALEVRWPSGAIERVEGPIATNQRVTLTAPARN